MRRRAEIGYVGLGVEIAHCLACSGVTSIESTVSLLEVIASIEAATNVTRQTVTAAILTNCNRLRQVHTPPKIFEKYYMSGKILQTSTAEDNRCLARSSCLGGR